MDPVTLDRWIAELYDCKPLTESEVESLCEKVHHRTFHCCRLLHVGLA